MASPVVRLTGSSGGWDPEALKARLKKDAHEKIDLAAPYVAVGACFASRVALHGAAQGIGFGLKAAVTAAVPPASLIASPTIDVGMTALAQKMANAADPCIRNSIKGARPGAKALADRSIDCGVDCSTTSRTSLR